MRIAEYQKQWIGVENERRMYAIVVQPQLKGRLVIV